ncbi:TonB-dependent receptor [Reichenbachiella carrageenanivorans]|uniref:TonB-dependent receptor n=1 Tax=Reichenbachiella carrageenanivorans TaxID=2979869 RepID=A0ABY6CXJ9_9BACT|nr:TonB-dependent receptor [Reichenbachiella carrageenanivorans]UXX78105.1 TonB-dependent receptor [Reichenbachiella carrageenanivorans]
MEHKYLLNKRKLVSSTLLMGLLMLLTVLGAVAQEMVVKGVVMDSEDGSTIPGVSIIVKGSQKGTVTNIEGNFSIQANKGDVLQFSFIGMLSQELEVTGNTISLKMEPDVETLDEVIVVGYGTQKKKEVTGAVAHLKGSEINGIVASDIGVALQGRIAGVNVVASSGEPGAASNILIRGVTSINGSNTPLYVVDGVPQDGDPRIPNNEIESIDVLKDAASAAIYGTRGSAGVILITTKSGEAGVTKIDFSSTYGVNKIYNELPLMNTDQALYFEQNLDKYSPGTKGSDIAKNPAWLLNDTDLRDLVQVDNAATMTYNLSVSGGQKDFSYSANFGYYDQEGVLVNSFFERYNGRLTTLYKGEKLSVRSSLAYTHENNDRTGAGLLTYAIKYEPYQPYIDKDTESVEVAGGPSETRVNSVLQRLKREDNIKTDRFNGSLDINYEIIKGLTIGSVVGVGVTNRLFDSFVPPYSVTNVQTGEEEVDPTKSLVQMRTVRQTNWAWTGLTRYNKRVGKHNFTALASFTWDERTNEDFTAYREGLTDPEISVLNNGTISERATSGVNYTIRSFGLIGRLNYDYKSKYLLSASVRRDGSSKFGSDNRWGVFPSVSVGWNVSEEAFWAPVSAVANAFKIRASYGTAGNESFAPYAYSPIIEFGTDYVYGTDISYGGSQKAYANALVQWETSIQSNLGVDLGLFNGKLTVTADYYDTKKKDMLFPIRLAPSNGVPSHSGTNPSNPNVILNVGDMTNRGYELAATYRLMRGPFKLNMGMTFAQNRNEITTINGESTVIFNNGGTTVTGDPNSQVSATAVGHEAGSFFLHKTDGVINTPEELAAYQEIVGTAKMGDLKYVDVNGDSVINVEDQVYAGSGLPDYEIGFNMNASYKGFDFAMQWYASVGHEVINGNDAFAYSEGRHQGLMNMWTPVNTSADLPIYRGQSKAHPNYGGTTDLWLEDGTYLRLKLVTLGYSLPKSITDKVGLSRARIYASGQNVLTFTNYTGYDPEVGGNNINQRGMDVGVYPVSAMLLMGIEIGF